MTRPIPPFSRADAVFFLAAAGAHLGHRAGRPEEKGRAAGTVVEALLALGVSSNELRVATLRGLMGQPSRWDEMLTPEPTEKEPENDDATG